MDAYLLFGILALALLGFVTGILRYDLVALLALLLAVFAGVVPAKDAFSGLGHPAVITVAAVLIISRGFFLSGLVDYLSALLTKAGQHVSVQNLALGSTASVCSSFMNNVGALALLLPVALRVAKDNKKSPSLYLMPLAFASLLGGLTTLIGTPPNVIVASFSGAAGKEPFGMFSYTPVGLVIAVAGLVFMSFFGWRLLPQRQGRSDTEGLFEIEKYCSELRLRENSPAVGKSLRDLGREVENMPSILAVIRDQETLPAYHFYGRLQKGDVLLLEAEPKELEQFAANLQLELAEHKSANDLGIKPEDLSVFETVIREESPLIGQTALSADLGRRFATRVLAVARQGQRLRKRIAQIRLRAGDVLLMQGERESMADAFRELKLLPLAKRELHLGQPRKLILSGILFLAGIICMVTGLAPAPVAFTAVAVAMVLTGVLGLREAYQSLELPILILLAAMMPIGTALETTGGAKMLADSMLYFAGDLHPAISLAALFLITMCLSDIINNAAAALLMAPIGIEIAAGLGVSPHPFLMAVAVSASCAFLTPFGHQSNTLVLGPGGYEFTDYARLGAPLEVLIFILAIPSILFFWPL